MTKSEYKEFEGQIRQKIAETVFLVEATDFERIMLRQNTESMVKWEQDRGGGPLVTVGHLDSRPVCVSLTWEIICGKRVCFWDPTSQLIDHAMIDEWFKENLEPPQWDHGLRRAHCNAMNFHLCLDAIGAYERTA